MILILILLKLLLLLLMFSCHGKHTSCDSDFEAAVPTKGGHTFSLDDFTSCPSTLQEGSSQLHASQSGPSQQSAIATATSLLSSQQDLECNKLKGKLWNKKREGARKTC